jgi:quercetin dioxygenase-like cupin family protein
MNDRPAATAALKFEDDMLRITEWRFAPGAATGWHRHGWPYFVVMLTDGILRIHDGANVSDVSLVAGQTYRRVAGVEHDVMNGAPHPIAFIEIEVKRPEALARV